MHIPYVGSAVTWKFEQNWDQNKTTTVHFIKYVRTRHSAPGMPKLFGEKVTSTKVWRTATKPRRGSLWETPSVSGSRECDTRHATRETDAAATRAAGVGRRTADGGRSRQRPRADWPRRSRRRLPEPKQEAGAERCAVWAVTVVALISFEITYFE